MAELTSSIARQLFSDKDKDIVIPDEYTTIGDRAFSEIPDGYYWRNRLKSVVIPDSVTSIVRGAFNGNKLTSVVIPDSVTELELWAFWRNPLESVKLPDAITEIRKGVFSRNRLKSVDIPDGIKTIGVSAFYGNKLKSTAIPDGVKMIGEEAFANKKLKKIDIPDSVQEIGDNAFLNNKLTRIIVPDNPIFDIASLPDVEITRRSSLENKAKNSDEITGFSSEDDSISARVDNDLVIGGGGADKFQFQNPGKFGKKYATKLSDFNPNEGDGILLDKAGFDLGKKVKLKTVASKKALKKASRSKKDFVYYERMCVLYFNENGKESGWGDGGLLAILQGKPELGASDFTIV